MNFRLKASYFIPGTNGNPTTDGHSRRKSDAEAAQQA
jgi:hypothetical protein